MFPELFRIGNFPVHTYGVLLALAFVAALFTSSRLAERDGLPRERVFDLGLWVLLGGLLGSKLLLMLAEPSYGASLWNLLSVDFLRSGGVWYGGFLGGLGAGLFLVRRYRIPFWKAADAFAPGVAIGQSVGRLGCFAAGCCWGESCDLPWGVSFPDEAGRATGVPVGVPLHPTQLYESAAALLIFLFLLWVHRRKRFDGQVMAVYAVLYAAVRFAIEFVRDDPRGDVAGLSSLTGLSTSQLLSLLVLVGGLVLLFLRRRAPGAGGPRGGGQAPDAPNA